MPQWREQQRQALGGFWRQWARQVVALAQAARRIDPASRVIVRRTGVQGQSWGLSSNKRDVPMALICH